MSSAMKNSDTKNRSTTWSCPVPPRSGFDTLSAHWPITMANATRTYASSASVPFRPSPLRTNPTTSA